MRPIKPMVLLLNVSVLDMSLRVPSTFGRHVWTLPSQSSSWRPFWTFHE